MRKVTKTVTEINTEAGIQIVVFKNQNGTIGIKSYFKDTMCNLSSYALTAEDAKVLAEALKDLADE